MDNSHREGPGLSPWALAPVVALGVLVLFQGGYHPGMSGIAAISFCLLSVIRLAIPHAAIRPLDITTLLFSLTTCLWCLLQPVLDGTPSFSELEASAPVLLFFSASFYCFQLNTEDRKASLGLIAYLGLALSILGILMQIGVLPYPGGSLNGRLMFTFQYANTAGTFFGSMALIQLAGKTRTLRLFAIPSIICMLLTKSIGSISIWLFVLLFTALHSLGKKTIFNRASLIAMLMVCVVIIPIFTDRLPDAIQTGTDRFIQILDGLTLFLNSPITGQDPLAWRYSYPTIQSAQYSANVIHCGYVNFAISYGLIGLTLLFAALILFTRRKSKIALDKQEVNLLPSILFLALHSAVDIDLSFGSISILLAMLLTSSSPDISDASSVYSSETWAKPSLYAGAITLAFLSSISLFSSHRIQGALYEVKQGQLDVVSQSTAQCPLLLNDSELRSELYQACDKNGDSVEALLLENLHPVDLSTQGTISLASCLYLSDKTNRAETTLLAALEAEPFNIELYAQADRLFAEYGISTSGRERRQAAAAKSNSLIKEWPANMLANQKSVPELLTKE